MWRFSRSSGPGGQHVNTSDSQVELRFDLARPRRCPQVWKERALERLAAGWSTACVTVRASEHRSQWRNRETAAVRLAALLAEATAPPPKPRRTTRIPRGHQRAAAAGEEAARRHQAGPLGPRLGLVPRLGTAGTGPPARAGARPPRRRPSAQLPVPPPEVRQRPAVRRSAVDAVRTRPMTSVWSPGRAPAARCGTPGSPARRRPAGRRTTSPRTYGMSSKSSRSLMRPFMAKRPAMWRWLSDEHRDRPAAAVAPAGRPSGSRCAR